jgi:hypothetical protein
MDTIIKKRYRKFIFLILFWPFILAGQTDSLTTDERSLPVLNNHYFIPNSLFPDPFITTFFKSGIGGGASLNNIPIYANDGQQLLGTITAENTFLIADIHIQVEAKKWLGAWFRYFIDARIGSSISSILAQGVTSITGFEFGWMLRLWQNKKSLLSGSIAITNVNISAINPLGAIKGIIDDPDSASFSLSKQRNPLYGRVGLRYAYSFSDLFGIKAFINGVFGESVVKAKQNAWKFNIGILGSFNFSHSHNVPVAFNLGYISQKFSFDDGQNDENIRSILFKVAYSGREEYNIGLEFTHTNTTAPFIPGENSLEYLTTSFVMVYYF